SGSTALWVGTNKGLSCLCDGQWTHYTTATVLPNDRVQSLLATRDGDGSTVLWIGTNAGLVRHAGDRWDVIGTTAGLANEVVLALAETSGGGARRLWAATFAGVSILDLDAAAPAWTTLSDSTTPALPSNNVFGICEDSAGRVYLSTTKGIARCTVREPT